MGIESLLINGNLTTDKESIAHNLNIYFTEIAQKLRVNIPPSRTEFTEYLKPAELTSFVMYPTFPAEILSLSSSINLSRSIGPDHLDPIIIKDNLANIINPLTKIFNSSLETGIIPDKLKLATVIPIFKQGNREDIGNYRPISISPYFSKLMEKIVYYRLNDYVTKKNIIHNSQHGFRKGHSTVLPLISIQDKITQAIERNEFSIGIFLDLSKAFDTVDHDILIKKLANYGIRDIPLLWFTNYLSNRYQQVKCNGVVSSFLPTKFGVPQGSILGPLLFLIYINDLSRASKLLEFVNFADDSNVFYSNSSYNELFQIVNTELSNISDWFKANKLSLNINKTNYILFSTPRKPLPPALPILSIDSIEIPQVRTTKFLGIYVDQHLTWNEHIDQIANKIAKNIGIIKRISYLLTSKVLLMLYYSMIYPYLSYCNFVWASNYNSRLNRLIILHKRIVRIMTRSTYLEHTQPLFSRLGLLNLNQITTFQISVFMFKSLNNLLPHDFLKITQLNSDYHNYNTRISSLPRSEFARTNYRKFTIKCIGPYVWNKLPTEFRCLNFSPFKNKIRLWLLTHNINITST